MATQPFPLIWQSGRKRPLLPGGLPTAHQRHSSHSLLLPHLTLKAIHGRYKRTFEVPV